MSHPYRSAEDGDIIRADDWNEIQSIIKEEVRTHRHGGGAEDETDPSKLGGLLRSESLMDGAFTTEKIAEDAVNDRVLATGSIKAEHFRPDASIDEHKVLFDPDEPVAFAVAEVTLSAPGDITSGDAFLWAIPAGTPITNAIGDIVFRTSAPVSLSNNEPSIAVAVRCEDSGVQYNVPAGTLTRVGGALDPFLREHISIQQLESSSGGLAPVDDQPPQPARAPVEFEISPHAPLTFWVVPKGTKVWQTVGAPPVARGFVTRQSLSVFPGSGWVNATSLEPGSDKNLSAGELTVVSDPVLSLRVTTDQPVAATGGGDGVEATVRIRIRLLGSIPATSLTIPVDTIIQNDGGVQFKTTEALELNAGGSEYVLVDPLENGQDPPVPGVPFAVDPDVRPRLDKIYDPTLSRYLAAEIDTAFVAPDDDPHVVRIAFSFNERAPNAAWHVPVGAHISTSPGDPAAQNALDNTDALPLFATVEEATVLARSGQVLAKADAAGTDQILPAGSLKLIVSSGAPSELIAALEVDQPYEPTMNTAGYAETPLRFRVVEGYPLPVGQTTWEVPTGTRVQDDQGTGYTTQEGLLVSLGGSSIVQARSDIPGPQGNVIAGILNRVMPDTEVRIGNVVDLETVTPYLTVTQPEAASGGGELLARARTQLRLNISERAPRTAWLVPRDTRVVHAGDDILEFETIDPLPVLPRAGWVWATPQTAGDDTDIPGDVLVRIYDPAIPFSNDLEIWQPDDAEVTEIGIRVRVWFRAIASATPESQNTWTIPAGTIVTDALESSSLRFETAEPLVLGLGGKAIVTTEADRSGEDTNGITNLNTIANPEDFECLLTVAQDEPAEGGADGGSDGHHHADELGALPSHPLADNTVGAEQVRSGAVTWAKLSDDLATRLRAIRDGLRNVETALLDAEIVEALSAQRHRSADL